MISKAFFHFQTGTPQSGGSELNRNPKNRGSALKLEISLEKQQGFRGSALKPKKWGGRKSFFPFPGPAPVPRGGGEDKNDDD
jgi:hypothetical protein